MKCLMKYNWVKLMRSHLPQGKGLMGAWARLASRAAFRKGQTQYCGYTNDVNAGEWSGGVVGVKSILGVKKRSEALTMLNRLSELGYITYTIDKTTKKLTYKICDWVIKCSGKECMGGNVYATQDHGFLCLPRNITERLTEKNYIFEESDAWLDLWCHTVFEDPNNAFSFLAPSVQYGKYGAILTLETLGQRWGWEKTKVWRFLKKHGGVFSLYRLPGSFGCLIYNKLYPTNKEVSLPTENEIIRILNKIRILGTNTYKTTRDHEHINKLVAWYSKRITQEIVSNISENRVADFSPIIRAYISHCWNCKNCIYDCGNVYKGYTSVIYLTNIRGPYNHEHTKKIKRRI